MNAESPKVIAVTPLADYKLKIEFENHQTKIFDVDPYLSRGVFAELKDLTYFNKVAVAFDSIQWPNGQDFSRDTLFLKGV